MKLEITKSVHNFKNTFTLEILLNKFTAQITHSAWCNTIDVYIR
jgi:hypothetical protein